MSGVCNRNVAVREFQDEIVFLHKIVEGGTDRSYGIQVARLAGVPQDLIDRAKKVLHDIESDAEGLSPLLIGAADSPEAIRTPNGSLQLGLFEAPDKEVMRALEELVIDEMTPIEALATLGELQQRLK